MSSKRGKVVIIQVDERPKGRSPSKRVEGESLRRGLREGQECRLRDLQTNDGTAARVVVT
jgi:hypothetical protein